MPQRRSERYAITLIVTVTICLFILMALGGSIALAFTDRDVSSVMGKIFELVLIMAGGIIGFITGRAMNGQSSAPPPDSSDGAEPDDSAGHDQL